MNNQTNNENLSQGTNGQPDEYSAYRDEEYERMRIEMEKRRAERRAREHRRVMKNRIIAIAILLVIIFVIVKACGGKSDNKPAADCILIVNKTYSLPSDYAPGVSTIAQNAFDEMAAAAAQDGITLFVNSSYRSYQDQESLYNSYAAERGTEAADEVSSRPGHSEHQTGLTFDVNTTEDSFAGTPEANWLAEHCAEYGFIIRYPEGKEDKTGYVYEPWHIRYLGKEKAEAVTKSGLCLEEYLGVTSDYKYAEDQNGSSLNTSDTQSSQADGYTDGYYQDNTNYDYQY